MSPVVVIIIGIVCKAYANVVSQHRSTLATMGSWTLKSIASILGGLCIIFGILMLFAGAA